jgi:hypothetical protein
MASANLKDDWADKIGQTQFLPSSYVKYAVDFDRKGRADLIRSTPDITLPPTITSKATAGSAAGARAAEFRRNSGMEQGRTLSQYHCAGHR